MRSRTSHHNNPIGEEFAARPEGDAAREIALALVNDLFLAM